MTVSDSAEQSKALGRVRKPEKEEYDDDDDGIYEARKAKNELTRKHN